MTPVEFMALFDEFRLSSWDGWREILARLTPTVRRFFAICGRGSGKSRIVALLACCFAAREYHRAPGERIYIGVFAPDRKQARVTFRYITGLLHSSPALSVLVEHETREAIELRHGVTVEVLTASTAAPRGRAYALAICEEAAMLPTGDDAADPDVEIVRAIEPALARVPGSLLAVLGSPYAPRGVLFEAAQAGEDDETVVVVRDTLSLNPRFSARAVARAFRRDPIAAASEYGRDGRIEFRPDVAGLLSFDAIAAVVPSGVREREPDRTCEYVAHADPATGSGEDAFALAVAYWGDHGHARLAAVRQWRPPFSPASVIREAADLLRQYGVSAISIDRFAPNIVADLFSEHGIDATVSEHDTSSSFVALLALVNSRRVSLLDDETLLSELGRLERRPGAGGCDSVGHPARGHDDVAAAAAQALVAAASAPTTIWARPWGAARRRSERQVAAESESEFDILRARQEWRDRVRETAERREFEGPVHIREFGIEHAAVNDFGVRSDAPRPYSEALKRRRK